MTDEQDIYSAQQYREHQEEYGVRDPHGHRHGGVTRDPKVSRYLSTVATHYNPEQADRPDELPGQYDDLAEVEGILGMEATETARDALENGDMADLKHLTGDQDERADISGIKAIGKIDQIIDSPAPVVVILGEMGRGKTDFANLFGQRAAAKFDQPPQIASNIKTLRETTKWEDQEGEVRHGWVSDFPTFREWMRQDGDPTENDQQPKIFIADEFSVSAGGQGAAGYHTATKLAKAIYLARKYRVTLIMIAHGPKSVHPLAWRVGKIVQKTSKKNAVLAERIKNNRVADKIKEIEGIPPTDWRYDTADTAPWSWTGPDEDTEDMEPDEVAEATLLLTVRHCYEEGVSARQAAKFVPYSRDWTNRRYNWLDEGEFPHSKADMAAQEIDTGE